MPKYTASRYVEQRFDVAFEAADDTAAKRHVDNMSTEEWGDEPAHTSNDQFLLFDEDGDELDSW